MITVCRMLQIDPKRSIAKALKIHIIIIEKYVKFTSVNVVLHSLACCRLTIFKTAISIFISIINCHLTE